MRNGAARSTRDREAGLAPSATAVRVASGAAVRVALFAAAAFLALAAPVVQAQSGIDVEPPLIEHEPVERGESGVAQEFSATVVDDRELAEVLLFHRFGGEESFDATPMRPVASSSVFTATVATEAGDTRSIEYYLQARDEAGNRVIKGYAFSPLVRRMDGGAGALAGGGSEPGPEVRSGNGRRWLYVGLGVLAVGALAAAAGGGDGGGGTGSGVPTGSGNTFVVTIDPP